MASNYAVQVKNIKKSFFLPNHQNDSFKRAVTQAFKKKDKGGSTFNALDGVSFNVEKGDFFGVLGRNGSGKSTLLKIISEIYQPTSGSVKHEGKVVSFIELGVGFKQDLTGRENVFLNGALLGFSKEEVEDMYDEIVDFAELEEFMDQKLKNYSSGMKVRLAFSVAIRAKADILILDEVLAVGDAAFQKKCTDYFETLKEDGKTVILVTHSMGHVRRFCNRAVVIEGGKVVFDGDGVSAAETYLELFRSQERNENADNMEYLEEAFVDVSLTKEVINLSIKIKPKQTLEDPIVAILINHKGKQTIRWVSDEQLDRPVKIEGGKTFSANLQMQNILPVGIYTVDLWVRRRDRVVDYGKIVRIADFKNINHTEYKDNVFWQPNYDFKITEG